ncbi:MAG: hypothetical protein ACR2GD_10915 [Pyrinomonadaceae bacterium]
MKFLSQSKALLKVEKIKSDYRGVIQNGYEVKAKNCLTCETQGICCADAHFVNVHVTRLEAILMRENLRRLSAEKQKEIYKRNSDAIEKYDLKSGGERFAKTFACPLFEKGAGCLIHSVKPVPCIQHACYARREDLPPDELQAEVEAKIEKLNWQTYGKSANWLPLPVWLDLLNEEK